MLSRSIQRKGAPMRRALTPLVTLMLTITLTACAVEESTTSGESSSESQSTKTSKATSRDTDRKPAKPKYTTSQKNAIDAATNYLSMTPFSKKGLIEQLSSSAGDGYPRKDAEFAVKHLGNVSWKEQAVRAAKNYLDMTSFSCQGLIEQLSSSAGDKYTEEQARYAAKKVDLC